MYLAGMSYLCSWLLPRRKCAILWTQFAWDSQHWCNWNKFNEWHASPTIQNQAALCSRLTVFIPICCKCIKAAKQMHGFFIWGCSRRGAPIVTLQPSREGCVYAPLIWGSVAQFCEQIHKLVASDTAMKWLFERAWPEECIFVVLRKVCFYGHEQWYNIRLYCCEDPCTYRCALPKNKLMCILMLLVFTMLHRAVHELLWKSTRQT